MLEGKKAMDWKKWMWLMRNSVNRDFSLSLCVGTGAPHLAYTWPSALLAEKQLPRTWKGGMQQSLFSLHSVLKPFTGLEERCSRNQSCKLGWALVLCMETSVWEEAGKTGPLRKAPKFVKSSVYRGIFMMSSRKYQDSFALEQLKEI